MHWETSANIMVRQLINDLDNTAYKYSDERLLTALIVSAKLVELELDFSTTYLIDITQKTITPDPELDTTFLNLMVLKTAVVILGGEVKKEAANSISIRDGVSSIDLRGVSSTLMQLYKDLSDKYESLALDYKFSGSNGQSILGPYSPGSDFVSRTNSSYDFRGGYFRY
jgi:hypothetical protein